MFRQDRTNPSTAVSNWRGRHESSKGWPSTAVSSWLNGGLFGGAAALTAFGGIITQYVSSRDALAPATNAFSDSQRFVMLASASVASNFFSIGMVWDPFVWA